MLGHNTNLNKFNLTEVTQSVFRQQGSMWEVKAMKAPKMWQLVWQLMIPGTKEELDNI